MRTQTYFPRPVSIQAFKLEGPKGPLPPPFDEVKGNSIQGLIPVSRDAVGQLLVPTPQGLRTCKIGDYVILYQDGALDTMPGRYFEDHFAPEGAAEPAQD